MSNCIKLDSRKLRVTWVFCRSNSMERWWILEKAPIPKTWLCQVADSSHKIPRVKVTYCPNGFTRFVHIIYCNFLALRGKVDCDSAQCDTAGSKFSTTACNLSSLESPILVNAPTTVTNLLCDPLAVSWSCHIQDMQRESITGCVSGIQDLAGRVTVLGSSSLPSPCHSDHSSTTSGITSLVNGDVEGLETVFSSDVFLWDFPELSCILSWAALFVRSSQCESKSVKLWQFEKESGHQWFYRILECSIQSGMLLKLGQQQLVALEMSFFFVMFTVLAHSCCAWMCSGKWSRRVLVLFCFWLLVWCKSGHSNQIGVDHIWSQN